MSATDGGGVPLSPKEHSLHVVGRRVPKFDALDKALGRAVYVSDMAAAGMLHAKLVLSPHPHARITKIDTGTALALPGVRSVVTHADVPRIPYNPRGGEGPMEEFAPLDKYVLDDTVRYVGDLVAGVAADTEDLADEAASLIDVTYELLQPVLDPEAALAEGAPLVHPAISRSNLATPDGRPLTYDVGDVEVGFREAVCIVERTYRTGRQSHVCPEPTAVLAEWDSAAARLTIKCTTQVPFQVRRTLAHVLDIPMSSVRVVMTAMGAGFGVRQECLDQLPIVAALAMRTGAPVKLVNTRREEFLTRSRHPSSITLRTGVKRDGTLTAMEARVLTDGGAYSSHSVPVNQSLLWMLTFYRCPAMRFTALPVYTTALVASAFRGYGCAQARFATEVHVDEICERLGLDPVDFRLKNCRVAGDAFIPTVADDPIRSCGLEECLRRGAASIGWDRRKEPDYRGAGATQRGMGMAASFIWSGAGKLDAERAAATVCLTEDGDALLNTGAADLGGGCRGALAQIAAETLGLPCERVVTVNGITVDTDVNVPDLGTYASRTTYVVGGAVKAAAEAARQELLESGAMLLGARVDCLRLADGTIWAEESGTRSVTIAEVVRRTGAAAQDGACIMGSATWEPGQAPSYAASFAEVEVDTETGRVTILRIAAAHDVGRAISPGQCEGQIMGGAAMGIGFALTEDLLVDADTGDLLNGSLLDYKIGSSEDMPDVDAIIVEAPEPSGPYGAKGLGELAMVTAAPAISNAIHDAVGVRMVDLPITPAKLLAAVRLKAGE